MIYVNRNYIFGLGVVDLFDLVDVLRLLEVRVVAALHVHSYQNAFLVQLDARPS